MSEASRLYLVAGDSGSGKTAFCSAFLDIYRPKLDIPNWAAGILSPAVFEGGRKAGIEAMDLRTGERRRLATLRAEGSQEPGTKHWIFHPEAVDWCNRVLDSAVPCQLLIVDELGPLEWIQGEGFQAGMRAVDTRLYQVGLIVVRSALIGRAMLRWPFASLLRIRNPLQAEQEANRLARSFSD